jgi:hypothetical protein
LIALLLLLLQDISDSQAAESEALLNAQQQQQHQQTAAPVGATATAAAAAASSPHPAFAGSSSQQSPHAPLTSQQHHQHHHHNNNQQQQQYYSQVPMSMSPATPHQPTQRLTQHQQHQLLIQTLPAATQPSTALPPAVTPPPLLNLQPHRNSSHPSTKAEGERHNPMAVVLQQLGEGPYLDQSTAPQATRAASIGKAAHAAASAAFEGNAATVPASQASPLGLHIMEGRPAMLPVTGPFQASSSVGLCLPGAATVPLVHEAALTQVLASEQVGGRGRALFPY